MGTRFEHQPHFAPLALKNIPVLFAGLVALLILKAVGTAIYNAYFHPLRKYPGPKWAAATALVSHYKSTQGEEVSWIKELHEKYGEIVRFAPDRLSFINPQTWKDIYGHRVGGRLENYKDPRFYKPDFNGEYDVLATQDVTEHGRQRKIFTNAFSDRALRLQEPLIQTYVEKLLRNLESFATSPQVNEFDAVRMYNATTFDIMGDLTFGEPLGMLDSSEYIPWVKAVFDSIQSIGFSRLAAEYRLLGRLMALFIPQHLKEQRRLHFQHSVDRVDHRLKKGLDHRPDIWSLVLDKGRHQLSDSMMHANASLFMIAGTETTATLLSGLTYYLLQNPHKLQKLVEEVRALGKDQLTLDMLPRLPYLNACFEEGLRMYPPVPVGLPRVTPKGGTVICGDLVPEDTRIFISQFSAYRSPHNFKDPDTFIPERWLPGNGYDSDRKEVLQPFAFGPRNCLGKNLAYHEMRIILASVLWHFDLSLCEQSANWPDQKVYSLWKKPELWLTAKPASKTLA